jgi:HD superfamily phosphodiesterase
MNRMTVEEIEDFVHLEYAGCNIMRNLDHIYRIRRLSQEIARSYKHDSDLLELGAYFHGTISVKEAEIR